ncbi:MAG: hypothetical protein U5N21_00350 [Rhodococcus sp. (in: high G+C Gram-positive bacteria)]|nr:hypothetical protein [Rhodococcus sp. (in: high G+C Gram-positive bacteria)]
MSVRRDDESTPVKRPQHTTAWMWTLTIGVAKRNDAPRGGMLGDDVVAGGTVLRWAVHHRTDNVRGPHSQGHGVDHGLVARWDNRGTR